MEEKIYDYLKEKGRPVTPGVIAKQFIISDSKVTSLLKKMELSGQVAVTTQGKTKLYQIKTC
jgi:Mn-dependent DtxR family transcriptional regulator